MSAAGASLGRNTAVMAAGTATSRVLGVIRAAVLVAAIGVNVMPADAFALANWLPNMLAMLLAAGVINAVLVPQVVRAYRSADGQQYVDRLLTLGTVLLLGVTALLTLAAPVIVWVASDQTDPRFVSLATAFAFWCIPQVFFYGMYTLLGQVLNARGQFGPYMWAPVVNNVIAIAGLVAFIVLFGRYVPAGSTTEIANWDSGMVAVLAGTATIGVIGQAAVLVVPLYRSGFRFRPRFDWRGAGLRTAGRVAGWTFAALVVGQIGIVLVMRVASAASQLGDPGIAGNAAYTHAFTIFMLPHSLIAVSVLTALFTQMSDHAAARNVPAVRSDFSTGLRIITVFMLFATVVLAVLALPLVRVTFPSISPTEAASLAPVIVALVLGLVALGVWSLCQRVFYAYEDTKAVFWIQAAMAVVVVTGTFLGYFLLPARWWVATIGAAISASYLLGAAWGGIEVWRRLGGGPGAAIRIFVRGGLAAGAAALVGWPLTLLLGELSSAGFPKALGVCVLVGTAMAAAYFWVLHALGVRDHEVLLAPLLERVRARWRRGSRASSTPRGAAPEGTAGPTGPAAPEPEVGEPDGIGRGTLLAGRYRLHQQLLTDLPGAERWTARDQILDRPVRALLLPDGAAPAQDAARRAALALDPRLLRILDVGNHEGIGYVVTEPEVGPDLVALTASGPLPPDQARAIIGEAADALETARQRGLHHLALRPGALRVTPDGSVLITGLAMDAELFGTEVAGAKETSRADTVALVGLLYLALTGRWPHEAGEVTGVRMAPATRGRSLPPSRLAADVPEPLDELCAATLGTDDEGPHSPGELVIDLEPWGLIHRPTVPPAPEIPSGPSSPIADAETYLPRARIDVAAAGAPAAPAAAAVTALPPVAATPAPVPLPAVADDESPPEPDDDEAPDDPGPDDDEAPDDPGPDDDEAPDDPGPDDDEAPDDPEPDSDEAPDEAARRSLTVLFAGLVGAIWQNTRDQLRALPDRVRRALQADAEAERTALPPPEAAGDAPEPETPQPETPESAAEPGTAAPETGAPEAAQATESSSTSSAAAVLDRTTVRLPPSFPPGSRPSPAVPEVSGTTDWDEDVEVEWSDAELEELVEAEPEPATAAPARRVDAGPIVLGIIGFVVIVGMAVAWNALTSPRPPIGGGFEQLDPSTGVRPSPGQTTLPTAPPVIASAEMLDPPPGDGNEHPEVVGYAIDGDMSTYWYSRTYVQPDYGIKDGIGFAITLAEPTTVRAVTLYVNGSGGRVEVRATDPEHPNQGLPLASSRFSDAIEMRLSWEPTVTQHIVLWFPELPQTPDGRNRIELLEVQVS